MHNGPTHFNELKEYVGKSLRLFFAENALSHIDLKLERVKGDVIFFNGVGRDGQPAENCIYNDGDTARISWLPGMKPGNQEVYLSPTPVARRHFEVRTRRPSPRALRATEKERGLIVEAIRSWQRNGWTIDDHNFLERRFLPTMGRDVGACDLKLQRDGLVAWVMLGKRSSPGFFQFLPFGNWLVNIQDASNRPGGAGSTTIKRVETPTVQEALAIAEGAVGDVVTRNKFN